MTLKRKSGSVGKGVHWGKRTEEKNTRKEKDATWKEVKGGITE